jgi:hypothetical protein
VQEAGEVGQILGVGLAGGGLLAAQEALDQPLGAGQAEPELGIVCLQRVLIWRTRRLPDLIPIVSRILGWPAGCLRGHRTLIVSSFEG